MMVSVSAGSTLLLMISNTDNDDNYSDKNYDDDSEDYDDGDD